MSKIPKPKYCGQDWLEMKPTVGGRICGQCSKVIVDFSGMTWVDIERIQQENNNTLCGMYSQKQLDNWGRQVPISGCSKFAATTALLISLATSTEVNGQAATNTDTLTQTIVRGTITGKTQEGSIEKLGYTSIILKGTECGSVADEEGNYQIDLTNYIDTIVNPVLIFSMVGFEQLELKLNKESKGAIKHDAELKEASVEIIAFYVTKPTLKQRIKRNLKKLFGTKR